MRGNIILKSVDFLIGIPIVFILGLFRRKKLMPPINEIKKIGILHTAAIGDTIICSPLVKDIQNKYPNAQVHFFCGKDNFEVSKLYLNCTVIKIKITNIFKTIKMINSTGKFDLFIDFGPWPRINSLITYVTKANFKIGFKSINQFRHYVYDLSAYHSKKQHELVNYRDLISLVDVKSESIPELKTSRQINNNNVVLHMFPGGYKSFFKQWPDENWIKVINYLTKKEMYIHLTGAPSDFPKAKKICDTIGNAKNINIAAGKLNLVETADLISESRFVISVNTGILHLASSLSKDIISLNGPTSIKRWGPVCTNAISVKSNLKCSPCLHLGSDYGCKRPNCMNSIPVDNVLMVIALFLEDRKEDIKKINSYNIFVGNSLDYR